MFRLALKNNFSKLPSVSKNVLRATRADHAGLFAQQHRSASKLSQMWEEAANSYKVSSLKAKVDAAPNDTNLVEYFQALNAVKPREVIVNIERGWSNGTIPVNEEFLKQYFKAAAKMGKLDSMNISGLLALLARGSVNMPAAAGGAPGAMTEAELSALIRTSMASASSGGSGGGFAGVAGTAKNPLYTATAIGSTNYMFEIFKMALLIGGCMIAFNMINDPGAATGPDGKPSASGGSKIAASMGLGSKVKRVDGSDKTFADVVGVDEAKAELEEIVQYLRDPAKFTRLGGTLPKGILLTGPPGTGKTLLAKAIAGEAKVPFYHASGSEFEEMLVGMGSRRIRDLFTQARATKPSIIFIDEIDAVGGKRNKLEVSSSKQTLNQLLTEMDGFETNGGVVVIGATNLPDSLDKALVRPGRFDKIVDVPAPDIGGRKAILELYAKKIPLDKDVNLEQIARATPGFTGAELFSLLNQAALKASVENHAKVGMKALEYAKDKIMMGAERKTAVISPESMKLTAFHEAGHALIALKTEGANPVYKATIMPRGRALGMVMQIPDGDQTSMTRKQMLAFIDICMGGRVAEELVFGYDNVTSGASSDIQQATNLATAMVKQYGLSDKVGFITIDKECSGARQKLVDEEIQAILHDSYLRAQHLLVTHRQELDIVAKGLLEFESLAGSEIVDLINGKALPNGVRSQRPSRPTQPLPAPKVVVVTNTSSPSGSNNGSSGGNSGGSKVAVAAAGAGASSKVEAAAGVVKADAKK